MREYAGFIPLSINSISVKASGKSTRLGFVGSTPHPVAMTTSMITCLVGNPYKPSFVDLTGWGVDQSDLFCFF